MREFLYLGIGERPLSSRCLYKRGSVLDRIVMEYEFRIYQCTEARKWEWNKKTNETGDEETTGREISSKMETYRVDFVEPIHVRLSDKGIDPSD